MTDEVWKGGPKRRSFARTSGRNRPRISPAFHTSSVTPSARHLLQLRGEGARLRSSLCPSTPLRCSKAECKFSAMEASEPHHQSPRKFARAQRREMTRAETLLWGALRGRRLGDFKFRRRRDRSLLRGLCLPGKAPDCRS